MKICTGTPAETGNYVVYMNDGDIRVRFWLVGTGWLGNLNKPFSGAIAGWLGPLPELMETVVEFDL